MVTDFALTLIRSNGVGTDSVAMTTMGSLIAFINIYKRIKFFLLYLYTAVTICKVALYTRDHLVTAVGA